MAQFFVGVFWFAVGYAASVWSWTKVHALIVGAEDKALMLRDQARALEASVRAKL